MSVRDVELVMIAGRVAAVVRSGACPDDALDWALSDPHHVMAMMEHRDGSAPEFMAWQDVRTVAEEAGLFRALVAQCRLEAGMLPPVKVALVMTLRIIRDSSSRAASTTNNPGQHPPSCPL